jgi:Zn-finger nucleic acid-binding protein
MTRMTLDAHLSVPIEIDLCTACQAFWFDKYESLKLSAASTLQLMKLIGEQSSARPALISKTLQCPRCSENLQLTNDMQRATRFSYWRCGREHGKFIRFFDFLKEKNFVAPMAQADIEELKKNVRTVNCSNCGAPIDLATSSACTHCGSAISILDMNQAQQTLA